MPVIVAIDGPAGTGKSSVAKRIAARLGFFYVDTGAIYRALALRVLENGFDPSNAAQVEQSALNLGLEVDQSDPQKPHYILAGKNVDAEIRSEEASRLSSVVAQYAPVRSALLALQRRLAETSKLGAVVEGRDIGTVVLPHADFKFFVTASPEIRAQRRFDQLKSKGTLADYDAILREIVVRDKRDSGREVAPLKAAQDAIQINTDQHDENSVVELLCRIIQSK